MKHGELIDLREGFSPYYTLTDEERDEKLWNTFIPHESFYGFLDTALKALKRVEGRGSVWLQGPYGVGKSHACAVVKHLLEDENEKVKEYLESAFRGNYAAQVKGKLLGLKGKGRFLVVTLKGSEGVPVEFAGAILEEKIRERLRRFGIEEPQLETSIDRLIEDILSRDIEKISEKLFSYENPQKFVEDLKKREEKAIREAYEVQKSFNVLTRIDFQRWLKEFTHYMREKGIQGILIVWDEFTGLLSDPRWISFVQNELAESPYLHLIIVTHRTEDQIRSEVPEDTINKIKDRFHTYLFEMKEVTAFQILEKAIEKRDEKEWNRLRDRYMSSQKIDELAKAIASDGSISTSEIKMLYPFHPYTTLLIIQLVGQFLSTQRSIFDFLYSEKEKGGFRSFLEKGVEEEPLLTPDYLWDFFYGLIEDRTTSDIVRQILYEYKKREEMARSLSEDHLKVLKVVFIFNLIYKTLREPRQLLKPLEENIKQAFAGTPLEKKVQSILDEIDEKGIVKREPNGMFALHTADLPEEDYRKKLEEVEGSYKSAVDILEKSAEGKEIVERLTGSKEKGALNRDILRVSSFLFIDSSSVSRLEARAKGVFKPYSLNVVVGVPTTKVEVQELGASFKELSQEYEDKAFVVCEEPFGEANLKLWQEYKAKAEVARNLRRESVEAHSRDQLRAILSDYYNRLSNSYANVIFKGEEKSVPFSEISSHLSKFVAPKVFSKGAEYSGVKNANVWKEMSSVPKFIEEILMARELAEVEDKLKGPNKDLRPLLRDHEGKYILSKDLRIKESADPNHPVVAVRNAILEKFEEKQICTEECFKFLKLPPYGIYPSSIYAFILALALMDLKEDLYVVGAGRVDALFLKNFMHNLFKDRKSQTPLRLGSEEDRRLSELLREIFSSFVEDQESRYLVDLRNDIRESIDRVGWPLWGLKYLPGVKENEELKKTIDRLNDFFIMREDDLSDALKKEIADLLETHRITLGKLISEENLIKGRDSFMELKIHVDIDRRKLGEKLRELLPDRKSFWKESEVSSRIDQAIKELVEEKKMEAEPVAPPREGSRVSEAEEFTSEEESVLELIDSLSEEELRELLRYVLTVNPPSKRIASEWLRQKGLRT